MFHMIDVAALGEILIDFTPAGVSTAGNALYEQNPGGAPANVLTAVCRQGGRGAFIGAVGEDLFGIFLQEILKREGIDTAGVQTTGEAATTLAFVSLDEKGDRSFAFCRKPGADQMLDKGKLPLSVLEDCRIFHFGSLSLCDGPSRQATLFAVQYAKERGKLISYDPNWRPFLWKSEEEGVAGMRLGLSWADILKLSQEELLLLGGTEDLEKGTHQLLEEYPQIKLIVVTLGADGCFYRRGGETGRCGTYPVKTQDTTGAGDAFWGALLLQVSQANCDILKMKQEALFHILDYANASGALCASGRGAIPSIPTKEEICALLKKGEGK